MAELKNKWQEWTNKPKGGDQCDRGVDGRGGMEINFRSPTLPMVMHAPLPSQRQGSKRACNLSVSSHPRVLNGRIGRDRGGQ